MMVGDDFLNLRNENGDFIEDHSNIKALSLRVESPEGGYRNQKLYQRKGEMINGR
jgi:hypothetical protein